MEHKQKVARQFAIVVVILIAVLLRDCNSVY